MKKLSLWVICLFAVAGLSAQSNDILTPAQIIQIMNDSPIVYNLNAKDFGATDFSDKVLPHIFFRVEQDSSYSIETYELEEGDATEFFNKAEEQFGYHNFSGARKYYLKALEINPNLYNVMVYVGDTYFHEKDYRQAKQWYEKAVKANYIDYLAHWGLAHTCMYTGEQKRALKEITIAKVLNRNNQNINGLLNAIYKYNKVTYVDWYLDPKYRLTRDYDEDREKDIVTIEFSEDWLIFALVNAIRKYEPDYATSTGELDFRQVKEALISTYISYDKKQLKKNIAMRVFKTAADQQLMDIYTFYEYFLPRNPGLALVQSEQTIEETADYIINVRSKFKK